MLFIKTTTRESIQQLPSLSATSITPWLTLDFSWFIKAGLSRGGWICDTLGDEGVSLWAVITLNQDGCSWLTAALFLGGLVWCNLPGRRAVHRSAGEKGGFPPPRWRNSLTLTSRLNKKQTGGRTIKSWSLNKRLQTLWESPHSHTKTNRVFGCRGDSRYCGSARAEEVLSWTPAAPLIYERTKPHIKASFPCRINKRSHDVEPVQIFWPITSVEALLILKLIPPGWICRDVVHCRVFFFC